MSGIQIAGIVPCVSAFSSWEETGVRDGETIADLPLRVDVEGEGK